jgi:hypothetical protein
MYDYRASEFGGCTKMLIAQRQDVKPLDTVPPKMNAAFQRGHAHEAACLATMQESGYVYRDTQYEVVLTWPELPDTRITGHLDGILLHDPDNGLLSDSVLEIKSPGAWRTFVDGMYDQEPSALVQRYKWQISIYMVATSMEATFVCLDENYDLRKHRLEMPFYDSDAILTRLQGLEEWARQPLPRLCSPREYPCKYVFLHEDDEVLDHDTEIDELATQYAKQQKVITTEKDKLDRISEKIRIAAGDRKKIKTAYSTITFYDRTTKRISESMMKDAGIDPLPFTTESVSKDILRVKGEDDAKD